MVLSDASAPGLEPDSECVSEVLRSPNFGERRGGAKPDSLILHYTGMPSAASAIALLRDPESQVSSHYVVEESGRIVQLVPEAQRAWHAGASFWRGERDINSVSIGIEICNSGHDGGLPPFPDNQIAAVISLCSDIALRQGIKAERILAHSDVAPARKRDPGEAFPWDVLWRAGVGHWVEAASPSAPLIHRGQEGTPVRALQTLLALYGYEMEASGVYDIRTEQAVIAFQRHFRPGRVDGVADASTIDALRALIAGLQPG